MEVEAALVDRKSVDIILSAALPKARSGKIMRRLLRDIAEGRALGENIPLLSPKVSRAGHYALPR